MASDTPDPAALARELIELFSPSMNQRHSDIATVARWVLERDEAAKEAERLRAVIANDCENEAEARQIAASVLGEAKANGDSHGVPNVADLVEMMKAEAERLRERVRELEAWKAEQQKFLIHYTTKLMLAGFKGDGESTGSAIDQLLNRVRELEQAIADAEAAARADERANLGANTFACQCCGAEIVTMDSEARRCNSCVWSCVYDGAEKQWKRGERCPSRTPAPAKGDE